MRPFNVQRAPSPSSIERRGRTGTRGRRRITTRSRWSAPSCATATSRRCRKSSALFAARELSPTTAAASTSTSTPRHTRPDAAHALQHRGQQGGASLPRARGWAEPRRATGTRTARRRSAAGGTRRPRSPGSRTGARPGTSTWTTRRGPPPPPQPCARRCRARTSRPPRRRARGPPSSSALKTEVSH